MNTFEALGVTSTFIKGLEECGIINPTSIQEKVIPLLLQQQTDMVSLAQTGTGKTAAFGLPLLQRTDLTTKKIQTLVLCPTRELCMQVARDLQAYAKYTGKLNVAAIYGGASIDQQINTLRKGTHIVVATPGRLNDLINRRKIDISQIQYVVFDEADEMLQMGFQDEINSILEQTPKHKNTLLFSATMPKGVAAIARKYMTDPVEITVGKKNAGAENVQHEYYMAKARTRYLALKRIVDNQPNIYSIIFCRTRRDTQDIADQLIQDGYSADSLHGDLSQSQRDHVMKKFRSKNLQLLVATDVAARGLDVNDLTHVINYNLPDDFANYTHRSGRTGRAGKKGTSIAIIQPREKFKIREIEKIIKKKFTHSRIPSGFEICRSQLFAHLNAVVEAEVKLDQIEPLYKEISTQLALLDREELIKKFLSLEFNRLLEYYQNAPDLNNIEKQGKDSYRKKEYTGHGQNTQFVSFFLNVGSKDGLLPQKLIGTINESSRRDRIKIGKIKIMKSSAILEADGAFVNQVLKAFRNISINGKPVAIEVAKKQRPNRRSFNQKRKGKPYGKKS